MQLSISEFTAHVHGSSLPKAPALRTQVLDIGDESNSSSPFASGTQIVEVTADAPCHIAFGKSPVATFDDTYLPPNVPRTFAVSADDQLAVIARPVAAEQGGIFGLLDIIADPARAKVRLQELTSRENALAQRVGEYKKFLKTIEQNRQAFDDEIKARKTELSDAERQHTARLVEIQARESRLVARQDATEQAEKKLRQTEAEIARRQGVLDSINAEIDAVRRKYLAA